MQASLSLIMEKSNVERERGSKLVPPGFRFEPTEEEIVFQYLSRKIFSHPLPAFVIPEFNHVFTSHPFDLPGDGEQDRYFFYNKEGKNNIECGKKMGRARARASDYCGYWKASGLAKRIICSKKMPIIGIRKSFVFHSRHGNNATTTHDWIMHEYYLALSRNQHTRNSKGSLVRIGNWTLCRIFLKERVSAKKVEDDNHDIRVYDFLSDSYSSSASSSESDIFTEVSSS